MLRLIAGAILIASFSQNASSTEIPQGYLNYLDNLYTFVLADSKTQLRIPRLNAISELIDEYETRYPSNPSLNRQREKVLSALSDNTPATDH